MAISIVYRQILLNIKIVNIKLEFNIVWEQFVFFIVTKKKLFRLFYQGVTYN